MPIHSYCDTCNMIFGSQKDYTLHAAYHMCSNPICVLVYTPPDSNKKTYPPTNSTHELN